MKNNRPVLQTNIPSKKIVAFHVYNFNIEPKLGQIDIRKWGWTAFSHLHTHVMEEHRTKGFGANGDSLGLSRSICYESFFPDAVQPFSWIIEPTDCDMGAEDFSADWSSAGPRPYHRPITECPFDYFKGFNGFDWTDERLYVPSRWALQILEYARWGAVSIAASLETEHSHVLKMADGSSVPLMEEMLLRLGPPSSKLRTRKSSAAV